MSGLQHFDNRLNQHKQTHMRGIYAWYKLQHIQAIIAQNSEYGLYEGQPLFLSADDAEIGRAVRELLEDKS